MILWNVFRIWPGERLWAVALVNYFTPWFGLMLIPLIILTMITGERVLGWTLLLAFILIAVRFIPNFTPHLARNNPDHSLKVVSFNVFQRNTDVGALIEIILDQDPDIVALQELTPEVSSQMALILDDFYPYHTLDLHANMMGQGLLSRFPINQISDLPDYNYQSVQVESPEGSIRIFNIHSPTLFPSTWKKDWQIQRSFFESLQTDIAATEGPLLVMGDFNTTPQSENYAFLARNLSDTFIESGWGFGFSYPAKPKFGISLPIPLVRIDYIFIDPHFRSYETRVLSESGGSDHRPVFTHLELKE
jgi:vancomycin resistance protein VanJ